MDFNEDLLRFIEIGKEKVENRNFTIGEYMRINGDAIITWDMVIEKILASDLDSIGSDTLILLESKLNENLNDPFITDKSVTKYAISKIATAIQIIKYRSSNNKIKPKKINQDACIQFSDMFYDNYKELTLQLVGILKGNMPNGLKPLINDEGRWIGNKEAAKVYYNTLLNAGIVKKIAERALGKIFSSKFENLGASFAGTTPGFKASEYEEYFKLEINLIKNGGG